MSRWVITCMALSFAISVVAAEQPRTIPANSITPPATQPVAAATHYFSSATKLYFACVDTGPFNQADSVSLALARGGDTESAAQLIQFCGFPSDLRLAGLVASYTPDPSIANAKTVRGKAKLYSTGDLAFGLARGLSLQGKFSEAAKLATVEKTKEAVIRALVLRANPTKETVESFVRDFPLEKLYGGLWELAEASVLVGDEDLTAKIVALSITRKQQPHVQLPMIDAYLRKGDAAKAEEMAKILTDPEHKSRFQTLLAREPARKGDVAKVEEVRSKNLRNMIVRGEVEDLLVYATARAGRIDDAKKLCEAPARESSAHIGARYGLFAAALRETGQEAKAKEVIEQGVEQIAKLKDGEAKLNASARLIITAVYGVDVYSYRPPIYIDPW